MPAKLIVVSGFLGAGKTSCIVQMGKTLIKQGKKVGVITNDQGKNLVDTNFLSDEGLCVFEVTQGCFCCNFEQFTSKLKTISEENSPDYILAEPIGSAINLITTIFKPVISSFAKEFTLAPLSVVTDPKRIKRLISNEKTGINFGEEINYLFDKQLQEADYIIINKTDVLTKEEKDEIYSFLDSKYPWAEILEVSAKNNIGIDSWLSRLTSNIASDKNALEIDYNIFTRAENNLAWLNMLATIESGDLIDFNIMVEDVISGIQEAVAKENHEIAHLKAYAVSGSDHAKAGVTSSGDIIGFNNKMNTKAQYINFILNARVEISHEKLREITEKVFDEICKKHSLKISLQTIESFAPSYAKPSCAN